MNTYLIIFFALLFGVAVMGACYALIRMIHKDDWD